MRVDKLLKIGIAGAGLYVAYRLLQAPKPSEPVLTPQMPNRDPPTPVIVPPGTLPDAPGPLSAPPTTLAVVTGSPLVLTPGSWYHGRVETGLTQDPREKVTADLQALGFGNVTVHMSPQEAATDIFQPFALANPGKGTRWFRARLPAFSLDGNPVNPVVPRPANLAVIWRAAPPRMSVNVSGNLPTWGSATNPASTPYFHQKARHPSFSRFYRVPHYWPRS